MIYTGLLSLLLAEYAANQKCSAVLLCSADSIYPILGVGGQSPTFLKVGVDVLVISTNLLQLDRQIVTRKAAILTVTTM